MTKLKKKSNGDSSKLKLWENSKTKNVTSQKIYYDKPTCEKTQKLNFLHFKNFTVTNPNCEKTQIVTKLKMWESSKT